MTATEVAGLRALLDYNVVLALGAGQSYTGQLQFLDNPPPQGVAHSLMNDDYTIKAALTNQNVGMIQAVAEANAQARKDAREAAGEITNKAIRAANPIP